MDKLTQEFLDSPEYPMEQASTCLFNPEPSGLEDQIISALRSVYDPEIPVNIYDLGLIYNIRIDEHKHVHIDMTLTAPGCPVAGTFPGTVAEKVREVPEITDVSVELVWEPAWTQDRMSEAAKLELGLL